MLWKLSTYALSSSCSSSRSSTLWWVSVMMRLTFYNLLSEQKQHRSRHTVHSGYRRIYRRFPIQRYDGHRPPRYLPAGAFLFRGNHVYPVGRDADGRGAVGCINTMGMPTSTTVSMVFELLGGTFALALIKVYGSDTLGLGDLINTDKALSVIMAIFVSVAIAFFFGMLVQWLARIVFTFNYTGKMKYSIGIFGGIAATSIVYFMLIKGLKDSSFMTPENKHWIQDNTAMLIGCFFVFFTILMQVLHWCKVNVFKIIVLLGTFALALAFAGNDLVNFIGVPLAGYSSFIDYTANGTAAGPDGS
mgnify:CR=1 FL=1